MKKFIVIVYIGIASILINAVHWQENLKPVVPARDMIKNVAEPETLTQGIVLGETDSIEDLDSRSIRESQTLTKTVPANLIAGIIPHDVYMGDYIAHFFSALSKISSPATIILIGPDHFERGDGIFTTTDTAWKTPYGILEPNRSVIHSLEEKHVAHIQTSVMQSEHSISALVPFIKYYFPDTKIVPIIMKAATNQNDITALRNALSSLQGTTVLVGAIDFSHYLLPSESDINDISTQQAIEELNENFFLSLSGNFNDYVDSPGGVAFVLDWSKSHGATRGNVLYHMNRADITGIQNQPSTSYFEAVFYK